MKFSPRSKQMVSLKCAVLLGAAFFASNAHGADPVATTQPVAKRKAPLVYPYDMLINASKGVGEVNFVVDVTGRVLLPTITKESDPEFAGAVMAMVEASEFTPATSGKKAVYATATERVTFMGEEALDAEGRRILAELRKPTQSIYKAGDLDDRPKALVQSSPVYPRAMKSDQLTGSAEIEFIIDRYGNVRFPRIVSATHKDFGWAAATAVAQWRYERPMRNGVNVDVRVTVPVIFDEQKLASSD